MKPHFFVLLSGVLTLGFGYWLAENSRDTREIWVSMGAWILGFWFASSLLSLSNPAPNRVDYHSDASDEDEDDDDDG